MPSEARIACAGALGVVGLVLSGAASWNKHKLTSEKEETQWCCEGIQAMRTAVAVLHTTDIQILFFYTKDVPDSKY